METMENTKKEILVEVKDLRISATNDDGVEIPIVKGVFPPHLFSETTSFPPIWDGVFFV